MNTGKMLVAKEKTPDEKPDSFHGVDYGSVFH